MGYTMSEARIKEDYRRTQWENRLEILRLRLQGWSFGKIAEKMGTTSQNVQEIFNKMRKITVKELEEIIVDKKL